MNFNAHIQDAGNLLSFWKLSVGPVINGIL